MAEESENTEAPATPEKKAGSKTLLIVGAVVGLIVVIGAPTAFFLMKGGTPVADELSEDAAHSNDDHGTLEGASEEEELEEGEEAIGAILPFDTFVVNLAGGRFIRLQLQVEFATLDIPRKFYTRIVPMRDAIIGLLTASSPEDLQTVKGKDALKSNIRTTINEMLRREDVRRIYFTQFVIQ